MTDTKPARRFDRPGGWRVPVALWLTLFIISFNINVMTVLIVPITRAMGANVGSIQNALVLAPLVIASFVPISQNLSDIYGHKRLFVVGQAIFAAGLLITALSGDVLTLMFGYGIVAGLGATPMVTLPWTLTNLEFRQVGRERELAFLALSMAIVSGSLVGPFVGGFLTTASDWRWAFLPQIGLVVAVAVLVWPARELVRTPGRRIDLAGGVLTFLGLAAVLLGINLADEYGWWFVRKPFHIGAWVFPPFSISIVPILIAFGILLLVVFAFYWRRRTQVRGKASVFRFSLFRERMFLVGLATNALYTVGTAGLTYALYLFLQTALELTPFDTALAVAPYYLTMFLVLVATVRLDWPVHPRRVIQFGLLVLCIGLWPLSDPLTPGVEIGQLVPGLVVMGFGAGLVVGQMTNLTLSAAGIDAYGESSGIYNSVQDLGYALGISIFGAALIHYASVAAFEGVTHKLQIAVSPVEAQAVIAEVEESLQILTELELGRAVAALPADVRQALLQTKLDAEFSAMRSAIRSIAVVISLALAVSLLLPRGAPAPGRRAGD